MKITIIRGPKEELLKVCDQAILLHFSKANQAKSEIKTGMKTMLSIEIQDGFADPLLDELVSWSKNNTRCWVQVNQI
jgi:hypothetical protein